LNAVFLKFGRDAEYQADELGAEIMALAGYNPVAMANFFELLRSEQGGDPGKLEQLFSGHPPSADREARIRNQAGSLQLVRSSEVGGFDRMRANLRGLSPAPSTVVAQRAEEPRNQDSRNPDSGRYDVRVDEPSSQFQRFDQRNGFFSIEHPDNWRAYAPDSGQAASFAPDGGVVETANGQQAMLYGVIVNHYAPFEADQGSIERNYVPLEDRDQWRGNLAEATDDLVGTIIRSNTYLNAESGSARREQIDGASSYSVVLSGRSPVTGQEEKVTVVTRGLFDGHVLYALCIVPGSGYDSMARTFARMLRTLNVNDDAAHRGTGTSSSSDSWR
jgi:hypothetical protein